MRDSYLGSFPLLSTVSVIYLLLFVLITYIYAPLFGDVETQRDPVPKVFSNKCPSVNLHGCESSDLVLPQNFPGLLL